MSTTKTADKIEEIALLAVMAHPADGDTLRMIQELFQALKKVAEQEKVGVSMIAAIDALLGSWSRDDKASLLSEINEFISAGQQFLADPSRDPFTSSSNTGWGKDLGQNADAALIVEFIQKHTSELDDVEAKLLAVTNADGAPTESEREELRRSLKSYLHNIKGDAGSVGFAGIERVTHALEEVVLAQNPESIVDHILAYKEWVVSTARAYSNGEAPKELSDAFLSRVLKAAESKTGQSTPQTNVPAKSVTSPEKAGFVSEAYSISGDQEILVEFLVEAEDHLSVVEGILLDKESGYSNEDINAIFRAVHSVKGGSSYFNLREITTTSHSTENLMDKARNEQVVFNQALKSIVLKYIDLQRTLLKNVKTALSGNGQLHTLEEAHTFLSTIQDYLKSISFIEEISLGAELAFAQSTATPPPAPTPTVVAAPAPVETMVSAAAHEPAAKEKATPTPMSNGEKAEIKNFVKIDTNRLDHLIEYIGEMVISSSMLIRSCRDHLGNDEGVMGNSNQLERISREIQQIGMSMRLIPLKGLFQKMSRVAWDTAKKINKDVKFEMEGEDTELDRSVIDKLADPLMHMVRNAVDHGIETPDARVAAGKPRAGTVKLSASHSGGNIYIQIQDDGRGLDPDKLIAKAREKGIVTPEQTLSREEAYHLIFAPGFSTAAVVTDVSGRGVGMDVVRKNIESMRGRVNIESEVGKGSVFTIELPLTLAIMEGIETLVYGERYILPALSIIEFLKPTPDMLMTTLDHGETLKFRGSFLPLYRVGELCELSRPSDEAHENIVVVVQNGGRLIALVVDKVIGKLSVVIKSLGALFENSRGVSGCAIMPDGSVGLILDIPSLVQLAHTRPVSRGRRTLVSGSVPSSTELGEQYH